MFVSVGLGDPKVRPKGVADGLPVNIPVLGTFRLTWGGTVLDNLSGRVNLPAKH